MTEITLKFNEILEMNRTLKEIIDDTQTKVECLLKFKLLSVLKILEPHVSSFESIRNEKIMEYGEPTKSGGFQIPKDNIEAIEQFNNDLRKILDSDVVININKLKASEVFDKGVKAEHLMNLYHIIEE